MADPDQLPYVIQLVDDDTEEVREAVRSELSQYGPALKEEIEKLDPPPSCEQREALQSILKDQWRQRLLSIWPDWVNMDRGAHKLEEGYQLLADYQTGYLYSSTLDEALDNLAEEYRERFSEPDVFQLASFLFEEKNITGDEENYYNPRNSNLLYGIKEKKGIPITLAALYKLVGERLDLRIEGCNFPGHFLTRAYHENDFVLIDCFHNGRQVDERYIVNQNSNLVGRKTIRRLLYYKISADIWFKRVLRNLIRAYRKDGRYRESQLASMLMKYMRRQEDRSCDPLPVSDEYFSTCDPLFFSGQIVKHKLEDVRGVIVDFDLNCRGSESWYSERTRSDRNQPWYVVLVDGSEDSIYVGESELEKETGIDRVYNPEVHEYFREFRNGFYVRNNQAWMEQRP